MVDNDLAVKIYIKARATPKVVAALVQREFDKIVLYSKQVGYTLHYLFLRTILRTDPQATDHEVAVEGDKSKIMNVSVPILSCGYIQICCRFLSREVCFWFQEK